MQEMVKLTRSELSSLVKTAVEEAVQYVEREQHPAWERAEKYFRGETDLKAEEGCSTVVATKCRDVVRALKPYLMRVFLQAEHPVEFIPRSPETVTQAEQATEYLTWRFWESDGYRVVQDMIHDACVKKVGIAKAYWDDSEEEDVEEFSGLQAEQVNLLAEDAEIEELEQDEDGTFSGRALRRNDYGCLKIESVCPEDFFIDPEARDCQSAMIIGQRTEMRVADVVAMGYDFDKVKRLGEDDRDHHHDHDHHDYDEVGKSSADESMRKVLLTECYIRVDMEGRGNAALYQFILGGPGYEILSYEKADDVPYAVFEIDPEPHDFFGRSLVELVMGDQDAATSMLRGMLDNVHFSNRPREAFDDENVNTEDMLNTEVGAKVRTRGNPAVSIMPLTVPFTAGSTLPAMVYYDEQVQAKTGVTRAAMGMDPDALQSTTAAGVNAAVQAGSGQAEVMARNLAEGGMRQLFRLMLKIMKKHQSSATMMRLFGRFVEVDPRSWDATLEMTVNVGLGHNRHEERLMALQMTFENQKMIYGQYGPQNGLVTLTHIRNAWADLQRHMGIYNNERYVAPMDQQTEQALIAQAQQAAQQQAQGDPTQALMQIEMMKAQARAQSDQAKAQMQAQTKAAELQFQSRRDAAEEQRRRSEMLMRDDLQRDQMAQDLAVKAAEMEQRTIDQQALAQEQNRQRFNGEI